jgi:eukaryotic-like serine/threonine-protein kinase
LPLETGSRFGSYEILELLNPGNAVEAYKATDTAKNRTVTIKLLPPHVSGNPAALQRVEREARALSVLSHPNICAVHEVAREGETDFVVSEFTEGDTLAKRLESGPLPLDEALKAVLEIADALNKAHRGNLIHGGLRPSNIVLTPEGAKLIDFGITPWPEQKVEPEHPATNVRSDPTSPDVSDEVLRFMSPEQIRGAPPDARSDIFAFGAVLYEMVTGARAFEGKNRPVLIAAISTLDPDPLSKTQPDVPVALDHVAQRCLEKDPDVRWQTAHDLVVQLRWVADGGDALFAAARARQKREKRVLAVVAAVVFLLTVAASQVFVYLGDSVPTEAFQFRVPVAGLSTSDISISPDGRLLALVAKPNTQESSALFVRQVASPEFQRLTGTEDATQPFWSPDSQSIAFVAGGRLKRVAATGGAPKDLGAAPGFTGGTWGTSQVILFGSPKGVFRISAEGGKAEPITTPDKQEAGHFWPSFLPDGEHYLYLVSSMEATNRAIFTGALDSKDKPSKVMSADSNVKYAEPGYLLFHREATLFAQPFDAGKVALRTGDPLHIADQLDFSPTNGRGNFDVSQKGSLVYFQAQGGGAGGPGGRGATNTNFQWGWVSRARGSQVTSAGETKVYGDMDLSPNERLIAVTQSESPGAASDIWVIDWQNAGRSYRLTTDPGDNFNPVWERPDGNRIAYTTYRKGNADIYIKNANTTGTETALLDTPNNESIEAWSQDGKYIAYKSGPEGSEDIWVLPLFGDKKPILMVDGPFRKDEPQFSYDGKWLAYASDESAGVFQVYVVSFPGREQKIQVSINGGSQPRWREDGKELFFRTEVDNMAMVATIMTVGGRIEAGVPSQLFPAPNGGTTTRDPLRHQWAVTRDGQRFLMRTPPQAAAQGAGITAPAINPQVQNLPGQAQTADTAQAFVSSGLTVIRNWPGAFQKETP